MTKETLTINEIIKKLRHGELDCPNELSNYLVKLSASLFEAAEFETEAQIEYAKKWQEIKESDTKITDKATDMKALQTDEYRLWQKMKNTQKCLIECIRSLKKKLANMKDEFDSGQNYG